MTYALLEALAESDKQPDTNVIVLTGAGRAFCAEGAPTTWAGNRPGGTTSHRDWHLSHALLSVEKPTIAMVNGAAVGLGLTMALFCNLVFVAEEAKLGDTHVNIGLVAGDGAAVTIPLLVGPQRAKALMLGGTLITGAEAARLGLVNRAVPRADLEASHLGDGDPHRRPAAIRSPRDQDGGESLRAVDVAGGHGVRTGGGADLGGDARAQGSDRALSDKPRCTSSRTGRQGPVTHRCAALTGPSTSWSTTLTSPGGPPGSAWVGVAVRRLRCSRGRVCGLRRWLHDGLALTCARSGSIRDRRPPHCHRAGRRRILRAGRGGVHGTRGGAPARLHYRRQRRPVPCRHDGRHGVGSRHCRFGGRSRPEQFR